MPLLVLPGPATKFGYPILRSLIAKGGMYTVPGCNACPLTCFRQPHRVGAAMKKAVAALLCLSASFACAQKRPAITGIAFVRMYTANPAASVDFYGNKLGFDH